MVKDRARARLFASTWFRVLIACFAIVTLVIGYVAYLGARSRQVHRQAFVVIGNPVVVVSWDRTNDTFLLIRIPPDTNIDAVHGYGSYALSALWKLDSIDRRGGALLTASIEESLATPTTWYIDAGISHPVFTDDPLADLQGIFSPLRLINYVLGRSTNIPVPDMVALLKLVPTLRGDAVSVMDLARRGVLYQESLADGTTVNKIDVQRFDAVIGDALEDEEVRKESIRIAVLNTTDMPGLGQRAARLLGAAGAFVTSVGNEEIAVDRCEVVGTDEYLESRTAELIVSVYGCTKTKAENVGRSDLVLKLGKRYGKRFLPYQ